MALFTRRATLPEPVDPWSPWSRANRLVRSVAANTAPGLWAKIKEGRASDSARRRVLLGLVETGVRATATVATALVAGGIAVADWFNRMLGWLSSAHRAGTLILLGQPTGQSDVPLALPDPLDRDVLGRESERQAGFLRRFRDGLRDGLIPRDGRVPVRSTLYARAVWSVGWAVARAKVIRDAVAGRLFGHRGDIPIWRKDDGHQAPPAPRLIAPPQVWEKRHLGSADHCPGCLREAGLGWVPVGTLTPIGLLECRTYCHCWLQYSTNP